MLLGSIYDNVMLKTKVQGCKIVLFVQCDDRAKAPDAVL